MKELFSKIKPIFNKLKPFTDKTVKLYKKYSDIATPTAVLAIICIVVTLALSSANLLTKDTIKELQIKNENAARQKLMDGNYEEAQITIGGNKINYHIVKDKKSDKTIGYIFKTSAKGYGGDISVMTAIKLDTSIVAIEILDASGETPGLGQNVTNEKFYGQFKGKGGKIDAVTGASISSKAVTEAVNEAYKYASEILAKGAES